MSDQFRWPELSENYPETAPDDGQIDFKKKLYEQKLEMVKNAQLARIAQDRAKGEAWIAQEKAALDAQIAQARARLDSELKRSEMKLQAEINAEVARASVLAEQNRAAWNNEYALSQAYHAAYIAVAGKQVERAARPAEFVQRAAAATGGLYLAVLAFTLVQGLNGASQQAEGAGMLLPGRGIIPTFFLGLAIVLASAQAGVEDASRLGGSDPASGTMESWQRIRRNAFIGWTTASGRVRRYALQAAALSLGAGICFLPVAFLNISDSDTLFGAVLAMGAVFLLPLIALLVSWVSGKDTGEEKV